MKRETENKGNTRALTDFLSPRSKVKDLVLQERSLPQPSTILQETPMKPSLVPNKLPRPPSREISPLQSPEMCGRDRMGSKRRSHYLSPIHSSNVASSSIGSSAIRPFSTPRERHGHSAQHPGSSWSPLVPISAPNDGTTPHRPPTSPSGFSHFTIPQFINDLSNNSSSSHIRRDQVTKAKFTLVPESQKVTSQGQESNKVAHHKRTSSSGTLTQGEEWNRSSWKRCREFDASVNGEKNQHHQGQNCGKTQTPESTVDNLSSTSLVTQPLSNHSSLWPRTAEAEGGRSTCLEPLSTFKPKQSSCASPGHFRTIQPMGAKQTSVISGQGNTVKLKDLISPSVPGLKKKRTGNNESAKTSYFLSSGFPKKDTGISPHSQLGNHHSSHTLYSTSVLPVKVPNRKSDSCTPKPASKPNSGSLSCSTIKQNKSARPRKLPIPDDIDDLFTPDTTIYVLNPALQTAKPKINVSRNKSSTSEKTSTQTVSSSSSEVTGSSFHKRQNVTVTSSLHAADTQDSSSPSHPQVSLPTLASERVKLKNLKSFCPKVRKLKNSPEDTCFDRLFKEDYVKSEEKQTAVLPDNGKPCTLETDTTASKQSSTFHGSQSPQLETQASKGVREQVNEEDHSDMELDVGLSFALDLDVTHSSQSSDEEQLMSLQEIMERVTKPPVTPEKGSISEPSTPGHDILQTKTQLFPSNPKPGIYKNNLDQMLKEINSNKRAKEIETQLIAACKEGLLRIAEYEEAEENQEEEISNEHQEFLQRYSLMSSVIREVPPGEVVFNLENFGQIFNQDTLQLRQCIVLPQGSVQKTLLWSSSAHLKLHLNIGLFQEVYDSDLPCPTPVTLFLFKMMSVHNERLVSEKILLALCEIACTAAYQIVKTGNKGFKVWVPRLADVALVLLNMGAAFITLFPFENLQPPFTEGDLLEDSNIKGKSPSSNKEKSPFPEHNYNNILKYLAYCMALCPRTYGDIELLLLLTVLGKVSMDTRLVFQPNVELYPLLYKIVNNIRDWKTMLPRICLAFTDLTDDHHNMCLLIQLLPDHTRGKQLRQHLSLSMISKLLDGNCTYRPTENTFQLSKLRPYVCRMQPSTLVELSSSNRSHKNNEDIDTIDQQSYYLCYSLLTLANEASNFQIFPAHQKEQLMFLCSELETYVKCDIRESEHCLYRSKVKDLVARMYTKWQILLHKIRPLNGKLYDYWQPLPDILASSEEEQETDYNDDGEGAVVQEKDEDQETSSTDENAIISDDGEEEGDGTIYDRKESWDNTKSEDLEGDDRMDNTTEIQESTKLVPDVFIPEMQHNRTQDC